MRSVEEFVQQLRDKYEGSLPFRTICDDENIVCVKAKLDEGLNGFYMSVNGRHVIILNAIISYSERRDWAWHELWHHFKSPSAGHHQNQSNKKEEYRANLFAALCRAPVVRDGDTIESLQERYNISPWLAKLRIEYEIKKMNG